MHFHDSHIASLIIILYSFAAVCYSDSLVLHLMLIVYIPCTLLKLICDRSDVECLNLYIECL